MLHRQSAVLDARAFIQALGKRNAPRLMFAVAPQPGATPPQENHLYICDEALSGRDLELQFDFLLLASNLNSFIELQHQQYKPRKKSYSMILMLISISSRLVYTLNSFVRALKNSAGKDLTSLCFCFL